MTTTPTERLFAVVAGHGPAATELATRALAVASRAHHGQFRRSGDPYITHPVAVAATVAEVGADVVTITAALLHDLPGDTSYSPGQIHREFGPEVGGLVSEFVRLDHVTTFDDVDDVDPRAVVIKIADRLHNMQTITCLEKSKQQRKADQTRHLVAPIARTLGLAGIASELDALASTILGNPPVRSDPQPPPDGRLAHGILRAAARALLPVRSRDRWLAEWGAELHALPGRHDQLTFTLSLLLGLPSLAAGERSRRQRRGYPVSASIVTIGIFGLVAITALIALLLDRSARARAWSRIADERRWNHDHRADN